MAVIRTTSHDCKRNSCLILYLVGSLSAFSQLLAEAEVYLAGGNLMIYGKVNTSVKFVDKKT